VVFLQFWLASRCLPAAGKGLAKTTRPWLAISTIVLKLKDFARSGSHVHGKVVISRKWCKTKTLLLHIS